MRTYVERYGVRPGTRAVVFTNNDGAYAAALALHAAGVEIAAIVDARPGADRAGRCRRARAGRRPARQSGASCTAYGRQHVAAVDVGALGRRPRATRIDCDLVCVSGGWNPAVHLFSQARGKLRFDEALRGVRARQLAAGHHRRPARRNGGSTLLRRSPMGTPPGRAASARAAPGGLAGRVPASVRRDAVGARHR